MFGRERPRRTYRVYAEDDFLSATEPDLGDLRSPDAEGGSLDGAPLYTAPRRALPGPLEGRFGVVLLALAAMALSALVVHLVRASIASSEAAPRPALAPASPPAGTPMGRGAMDRGVAFRARAAPPRLAVGAGSFRAGLHRARSSHGSSWAHAWASATARNGATPAGETSGSVDAPPASEISAATPEFGFEGDER